MSFVDKYLKVKTRKYHPAVLIVWAALSATAMLIPGVPTLGTGSTMSLTYPLAPLAGIFFGPFAGGLSTMVGSIIGTLIAPHAANLGIWTFTTQTFTAIMAGYIARGKWQLPAVSVTILTVWMYALPPAQEVWFYFWIPLHGIILSIICAKFVAPILKDAKSALPKKTIAIFVLSYTAFIVGIAMADPQGVIMYDLQAELYYMLVWLMPVERLIFALFTTILGVPLLVGLPKIKVFVGPAYDETENVALDDVDRKMQEQIDVDKGE